MVQLSEKLKRGLSTEEAMENLETIADMDLNAKSPIGLIKDTRITTDREDLSYGEIIFPEDPEDLISHIKPSYLTILQYLKLLYYDPDTDWEDPETEKTVRSMMEIASDAAKKINDYFLLFSKKIDFKKEREFLDLEEFYSENIASHFSEEGSWKEGIDLSLQQFDLEGEGISDFNMVEQDLIYELFQMNRAEGECIISPDLLRAVKLFYEFDEEYIKAKELPFDAEGLKKRDLCSCSQNILRELSSEITKFYKGRYSTTLSKLLNLAIVSLMLASNEKNMLKGTFKSTVGYFKDFQLFLREALLSKDYQHIVTYHDEAKDQFLADLLDGIIYHLFTRRPAITEEVIGYIHRFAGEKVEEKKFLLDILKKDSAIDKFFKKYPNRALFKVVELLKSEEILGFDPIFQENIPKRSYQFNFLEKNISFLSFPSPTNQTELALANIDCEFRSFLQFLKKNKKRYLMINLQDRDSILEEARAEALEGLQKRAEYCENILVVSLNVDSIFYHQEGRYHKITDYKEFARELKKDVEKRYTIGKGYGDFIEKVMDKVHELFFLKKRDLAREERLDFIELFHHFFILKMLEKEGVDFASFTCKDGVDKGASFLFSFFYFVKSIRGYELQKRDRDFMLFLIYESAMLVRERKVDTKRVDRMVSFLSRVDDKTDEIREAFSPLYCKDFLFAIDCIY